MTEHAFRISYYNQKSSPLSSYRDFRRKYFQKSPEESHWTTDYATFSYNLTDARKDIRSYREHIINAALHHAEFTNAHKPFIARALGLHEKYLSPLNRREKFIKFVTFFLPTYFRVLAARKKFREAKTYEARELVFNKYFESYFLSTGLAYTESLDYALTKLIPTLQSPSISDLKHCNIHWIKLTHQLGASSWNEAWNTLQKYPSRSCGEFTAFLVKYGLITTVSELNWVVPNLSNQYCSHHKEINYGEISNLAESFVNFGVSREVVVSTLLQHRYDTEAVDLDLKLSMLNKNRIRTEDLLKGLGSLFWKSSFKKMQFLVEKINFSDTEKLIQCRDLLTSSYGLNEKAFNRFNQLGATTDNVIQAQKLLIKINSLENSDHCLQAMELLMGRPYKFTPEQISSSERYIINTGNLSAYLEILSKHRLLSIDNILSFQDAYPPRNLADFDHLLCIAIPRCKGDSAKSICCWLMAATQSGYFEVFDYLILKLNPKSLSDLKSILKFANVCLPILQYVVDERGIRSVRELNDWYYQNAIGVRDVRLRSKLNSVERLLLDDAFDRGRFSLLLNNLQVINNEIARRVNIKIKLDEASNEGIEKLDREFLEKKESQAIANQLPEILDATGGVLLHNIVCRLDDLFYSLQDLISEFQPLISQLLTGCSPTHRLLTKLEAETISLIYRVSPQKVEAAWPSLIKETDLSTPSCSQVPILMNWHRKELRLAQPLDVRGFTLLEKATYFAKNFKIYWSSDMDNACLHLSPKRLSEKSRDIATLSQHLGLLLAIGNVLESNDYGFSFFERLKNLSNDESSYTEISTLANFFAIGLKDAIADNIKSFQFMLQSEKISMLMKKITNDINAPIDSIEDFPALVDWMLNIVLSTYFTWARKERNKFRHESNQFSSARMHGIVSKYPAAYFAPIAVGICTAGDLTMWNEERFSIFLIFDEIDKRLAGMAYIYKHTLSINGAEFPILVARALNTLPEYVKNFDENSIVENILDALIFYAKSNHFKAMALPQDSGMHLLSNDTALDRTLKKRIAKSKIDYSNSPDFTAPEMDLRNRPVRIRESFDAYALGNETVDNLYMFWKGHIPPNDLESTVLIR